jgi:hypothetical protein
LHGGAIEAVREWQPFRRHPPARPRIERAQRLVASAQARCNRPQEYLMNSTKTTRPSPRTPASHLRKASPELRRLVERLVAEAAIPRDASLIRIRAVLAGPGIVMNEGEMIHPQDRTSFLIELDQLIERRAHGSKVNRRAGGPGRPTALETGDRSAVSDGSAPASSSAVYGSNEEPERSEPAAESVEDPLRDWPEADSAADPRTNDGPESRSTRDEV